MLRFVVGRQHPFNLGRRIVCTCTRVAFGGFNADTIQRSLLSKVLRAVFRVWHGHTSDRATVSGLDGEGCGEGAGEEEMDFAIAEFQHSRASRDLGGGGFTGLICVETNEASVKGAAKLSDVRDVITPGGNSPCIVELV